MKGVYSRIGFNLRSKEKNEIIKVQNKLEKIFNIEFKPFESDSNETDETLVAYNLGLLITLTKIDIELDESYYIFSGSMRYDLDEGENDFSTYVDISDFILGILAITYEEKWYKPTQNEIYGI